MLQELLKLKHAAPSKDINYLFIPVTNFDMTEEGAKEFNRFYLWLKQSDLKKIERTPSGGIKKGKACMGCAWDYTVKRNSVELTILLPQGSWRLQIRSKLPDSMSGRKAFTAFKRFLKKRGIDLNNYIIEDGKNVKMNIEKPLIKMGYESLANMVFEKVNHIDFHSSYAGGLAITHPEFKAPLEELYKKRNEKEIYKNILNFSIGFMQSDSCCKARWAHLSRDAIKNNNERVKNLAEILEKKGRIILLFNTDGIWYKGPVYHGAGEGEGLGQWHNDHVNCKFRMKSAGAYEYIENGIYTPVVRGVCMEKRESWVWGDIYSSKADPDKLTFEEGRGVLFNGEVV